MQEQVYIQGVCWSLLKLCGKKLTFVEKKQTKTKQKWYKVQKIAPIYRKWGKQIHLDYIHNSSILWIDGLGLLFW